MNVKRSSTARTRPSWIRKAGSLLATGALVASGLTVATAVLDAPAAQAEQNVEGVPAGFNTTFFAYMQAGESLDVSFTKVFEAPTGGGGFSFTVTDPTGAVAWTCAIPADAALGTTCAVPDLVGPAGAWTIAQAQTDDTGGAAFDWNITVSSGAGVAQSGRVWTENYGAYQTDGVQTRDLSYTVLNDTGYRYAVNLYDYNGIGSRIIANSLGLTDAEGAPRYESGGASGINPALTSPPYRIFFEEPSGALPASAPSAQGEQLIAPPLLTTAELAVDDLAFAPSSANSGSGTFTYSIDERFSGAYNLQVDTNGNGSYDDAVDRTIALGADGSGEYSYDFDGLDGAGSVVADCTLMNARIFFEQLGEFHLLQVDVEGRTGGIEIIRQNGSAAPDDTIYWNDTNLEATTGTRANTTPVLDGTAGVSSTGGVHGWANNGNSWGNNRTIDDWAYDPIALEAAEIQIGGRCLEMTKTSDATEDTRVGDTVTYTVTAENTGVLDYTDENPATFTDDLSGVLDDADYNADAETDVEGTIAYVEPKLSWTGALPAGDTVTMTYTTTLTATGDGIVRNVAYGTIPEIETPVCDPPDEDGTDPVTGIACAESEFELPRLTITKTASETELPVVGTEVTYTVTATNEGPGDFTDTAPARVTDDLTDVLDDATYNDDATSTVDGTLGYTSPEITWEGALEAGETVTLEYTVTYTGAGDLELINTACVPEADALPGAEPCASFTILAGLLDVNKSVDPEDGSTVTAGEQVTYTLTFDSIGTAAADVAWTDDLSAVLDDAVIVTAPSASSGDVTLSAITEGRFTITGSIPAGETVTVTYTVEVLPNGERGDDTLGNFLFEGDPPVPGTECAADDPLCTVTFVSEIVDSKSASPESGTTVVVGQSLTYTLTFENIGEGEGVVDHVDYLSGVLDDADLIVEPVASDPALTVTREGDVISITGSLDADQVVSVTYTVQVRPEAERGDSILGNFLMNGISTPPPPGTVCTPGEGEFPDCTVHTVGDIVPAKTVNPASGTTVAAGNDLTYTLSFRNAGAAAAAVNYTDHMSGVLDDANFVGTAVASAGLTATGPTGGQLVITGTVEPGQTLTVTYTVRVKAYDQQGDHLLANFLVPEGGTVPAECLAASPLCTQNPIDPPAGLAVTGGQVATGVLITALALLVGGGVLLFVRRRRAEDTEAGAID